MSNSPSNSVQLRPYRLDDADRLAMLLNDPEVTAMTSSIPYPYARSDAEAFLSGARNEQGREVSRAIVLGEELVGGVGFKARASEDEELGYWIGKPYWGQGIATLAVGLFLAELKVHGVEGPIAAQTVRGNIASQKVLTSNGFTFVGEGACSTPARETTKMPSNRYVRETLV